MKFKLETSELFVSDGLDEAAALRRTTHMAIGAHQDDLEIMAIHGILTCFQRSDNWFAGVVVTNGRGSPRDDLCQDYSGDEMRLVRFKEQKKAAVIGEYSVQALLDAMDLTPLIEASHIDVPGFVQQFIERFSQDVSLRLAKVA